MHRRIMLALLVLGFISLGLAAPRAATLSAGPDLKPVLKQQGAKTDALPQSSQVGQKLTQEQKAALLGRGQKPTDPGTVTGLPADRPPTKAEATAYSATVKLEQPGTDASGGPDADGYQWVTSDDPSPDHPTYAWATIDNVMGSFAGDDNGYSAVMPFAFPYRGTTYGTAYWTTNGAAGFTSGYWAYYYLSNFPNTNLVPACFGLQYRDLYTNSGTYGWSGTAPNRTFIIQWTAATNYGGTGSYSMQLILTEGGEALYEYATYTTNGYAASVGYQNVAGTIGANIGTTIPAAGKAIRVWKPSVATDMGAVSMVNITPYLQAGEVWTLSATVKNFGSTTQNPGVPVNFTIVHPDLTTENWSAATTTTLVQNATEVITFTPDWTVPAGKGTYTLKCSTALSGDQAPTNDQVQTTVYVYTGFWQPFTDVNMPPADWTAGTTNPSYPWVRSTTTPHSPPACAYYNSYWAPSGSQAWLISPRLDLTLDPADSVILWWAHPGGGSDYIYVELSTDGGVNYSTVASLTGNQTGWGRVAFGLESYAQTNNAYLKFRTYSAWWNDLWMDDILGPAYYVATNDVGVSSITTPGVYSVPGAVVTPTVQIFNYGVVSQNSVPVEMRIYQGGVLAYTGSTSYDLGLAPGATATVTFSPDWTVGDGAYTDSAWTSLVGDEDPGNDTAVVNGIAEFGRFYPLFAANNTGTCNPTMITQPSQVNAYSGGYGYERGWMRFDLSGIPSGSTINSVSLHSYVNSANYPYYYISRMTQGDPLTEPVYQLYNDIDGADADGYYYAWYSGTPTGWNTWDLGAQGIADVTASLDQDYIAVGWHELESYSGYQLLMQGWDEDNPPYLLIDYDVPLPNDVGATAVVAPTGLITEGAVITPTVTIKNFGLNTQNSIPVFCQISKGGTTLYTANTTYDLGLAQGATADVTFSPDWTVPAGAGLYNVMAWTDLPVEENRSNDTAKVVAEVFNYRDTLKAPWRSVIPTLDGVMSPGEWDEAEWQDISDINGQWGAGPVPAGTVIIYVKHDSDYVYWAVDLPYATTRDAYDEVSFCVDENYDKTWDGFDFEGNHWIEYMPPDTIVMQALPNGTRFATPSGGSASSLTSGHLQFEGRIAKGPSEAQYTINPECDTVGLFAYYIDEPAVSMWGCWPTSMPDPNTNWANPSVYGTMFLLAKPVAPSAFDLLTPANHATDVPLAGTMTWSPAVGATRYDVYYDNFTPPTTYRGFVNTESFDYSGLSNDQTIYWSVIAINAAGNTPSTSIYDFSTPATIPSGWSQLAPVPGGGKAKNLKEGANLTYLPFMEQDVPGSVFAFKGNNRYEFYQYNITDNVWTSKESIPAYNLDGKKKSVKKGSVLVTGNDGKIYASKGNNTVYFWQYDPLTGVWTALVPTVPYAGDRVRGLKEGTGAVAVGDNIYLLKGSGTTEFYRYNTVVPGWETMANAPLGPSNKPFKNGSRLAFDGVNTIYAVKGSYNTLYAYDVTSGIWTTKDSVPKIGSMGKKKKVKDGSGLAYANGMLYVLKGGNTNEFFTYDISTSTWSTLADMPVIPTSAKRVKGGGNLIYASDMNALYAFRGNNTLQFWSYGIGGALGTTTPKNDIMSGAVAPKLAFGLSVAPNPFTNATTIAYSLAKAGNVSLKLYDVTGTLVTTLAQGYTASGSYSSHIDATKLARGIYVLKFATDGYNTTRKLILE